MSMEPDDLLDLEETDDNPTIKQMRKQLDSYAQEKKKWEKGASRLAELEETVAKQESERRVTSAASVLPDEFKGLADVFAEKHDGELNAESATAFLQARGLVKPPEPTPDATPPFVPTAAGQPPPPTMIPSDEIDKLFRAGKIEEGQALLAEGIERGTIEWTNPAAAQAAEAVRRR